MSKDKFRDVWHSFRLMKKYGGIQLALEWIGWFNMRDKLVIMKLLGML